MKYSACITIVDDEGNIVHERELDTDAIIAELLQEYSTVQDGVQDTAQVAETTPAPISSTAGKGCTECGSPRRHKNGCTLAPAKATVAPKPVKNNVARPKDDDEPLTESEYDDVMQGKKDDLTSLQVTNELNVPFKEVNLAWGTPDYDYYIEHR